MDECEPLVPGALAALALTFAHYLASVVPGMESGGFEVGAYTRPLFCSTLAVLVTPPRVPLSTRLGGNHAPNVSDKMCLG